MRPVVSFDKRDEGGGTMDELRPPAKRNFPGAYHSDDFVIKRA